VFAVVLTSLVGLPALVFAGVVFVGALWGIIAMAKSKRPDGKMTFLLNLMSATNTSDVDSADDRKHR
jgi:hypothetical protein